MCFTFSWLLACKRFYILTSFHLALMVAMWGKSSLIVHTSAVHGLPSIRCECNLFIWIDFILRLRHRRLPVCLSDSNSSLMVFCCCWFVLLLLLLEHWFFRPSYIYISYTSTVCSRFNGQFIHIFYLKKKTKQNNISSSLNVVFMSVQLNLNCWIGWYLQWLTCPNMFRFNDEQRYYGDQP